ncbi:MAG: hypothetical protein J6T63_03720 [Bacteroidales bacterium]|nr:hypothetical protein [Bacteroidales bacterium]
MALIDEKIALFKTDVGNRELNEEQKRVFDTFCRTKGKLKSISTTDNTGTSLVVKFPSDDENEGTQHVLLKHYKTNRGSVTAMEILNLMDVVRCGNRVEDGNHIIYCVEKYQGRIKFTFAVKVAKRGNIFKSFYSDRQK